MAGAIQLPQQNLEETSKKDHAHLELTSIRKQLMYYWICRSSSSGNEFFQVDLSTQRGKCKDQSPRDKKVNSNPTPI